MSQYKDSQVDSMVARAQTIASSPTHDKMEDFYEYAINVHKFNGKRLLK